MKLVISVVVLLASVTPCRADEDVGLGSIIAQPGVKLVAVEFWAEWCKPCMESVPRWQELHEEYRDMGFRLVVVAVSSQGRCSSPGWVPDKIVCDYTGEVAKSWSATELPQAFLWTWQGKLLLEHATVEQVAARVGRWFAAAPRILVEKPRNQHGEALEDGRALRQLVRSELSRQAKFDIILDEEEMGEVRRLRKEAFADGYAEQGRCRLGQEISANSMLRTTVLEGRKRRQLLLELFSFERGCLTASAVAPVPQGRAGYEKAAIEAVAKLAMELSGSVESPTDSGRSSYEVEPTADDLAEPEEDSVSEKPPATADAGDLGDLFDSGSRAPPPEKTAPPPDEEIKVPPAVEEPPVVRRSRVDSILGKWWFWTGIMVGGALLSGGGYLLYQSLADDSAGAKSYPMEVKW